MLAIVRLSRLCFSNCKFSGHIILNYLQKNNVVEKSSDFIYFMSFFKNYNLRSFLPVVQDLKDDCIGFLSDEYRLFYLNKNEVSQTELMPYLSSKNYGIYSNFYNISGGSDSYKVSSLNEYLTGPGKYREAFSSINENNQMSFDCFYLSNYKYVNKEKGLILYDYWEEFVDSEDEEKLCELSVPNFTAAMTTAKIYCAPCAYNSVFTWDEFTQKMELSINNMCFKIIPEVGEVKHPRVNWRDIYFQSTKHYERLKNNYYSEKS